ncbi:SusD/RagB family nutrient-binding outer membrane lipoprotein [Proteiniphilum sp. X52]|uniref:SusD/RagB family nutrient-binding outer membrane lipoprotein n=1 Tax=Proteiniphilum sp. X52 TaxID=2382159 RepID=UPI000F0A7DD2|nr:SusD/RagB family nutrient-binding outer membrane lipoprotein [Proteiniphilum sp. X52]RNC64190.1 SusD/RagB family nutrient-binding outer membrane lipoprotein [Proteiniphilum sp. X52]
MKRIFILMIGLGLVAGFNRCADDDYSSKYNNPEQTSEPSIEKLMTGVFHAGRDFTFNSYWRSYTWENGVMGVYAQTIGFLNAPGGMYTANDSYANNRWENFYDVLAQFRILQHEFGKLDAVQQANYKVFVNLSEIFVYDHLSQIIDTFGDVPFSKAGYLYITNDLQGSYPSYDKATDIYSEMLDRLGEIYTELNAIGSPNNILAAQDFINKGDLSLWIKYCNSLRLRLAMRVASQGDLSSKGRQIVAEILNGNYPLVSALTETIQVLPDTRDFNYGDEFRDGFKDHSRASQEMLNVLLTEGTLGENDPRLPIMYSTNAAGEYKGLSTHETYAEQQTNTNLSESQRVYSRIDSTTVIFNRNLISPIVTAAEVDFMKAEAFQRGWADGDAKQAFIDGILHSTQFYFEENKVSPSSDGTKMDIPAESLIVAYAEKVWNAATNKEIAIITQKWLNFGFLQPFQAWNEIRRTGYPEFYYPEDVTAQLLKTLPNRVRYPASERNNNTENYNAQVQSMGGTDDAYIKPFWAK